MPELNKELVFDAFSRYAGQPALVSTQHKLTWGQLYQQIMAAGKSLEKFNIGKDDKVAILCENCVEYVIICMALWARGAVVVPVSVRWPRRIFEEALRVPGCRKLITAPNQFYYDVIIQNITIAELALNPGQIIEPSTGNNLVVDPAADCTMLFTSGSYVLPKVTLHSWANHYYSALGSNQNIAFGPGKRWLLALPLYHTGGMAILFRALVSGGCIALPDPALSLEENIGQLQITHVSLVATQLYRMLQEERIAGQLAGLEAILLGGSAMPEALIKKAVAGNLPVYTSYGSTEMASQITTTRPGDSLDRLLSSGTLLPYRELQISDTGEILVRGRTLFKGYVKKRLAPAVDAEGWFHSGDLGFIDKQGYLHVTGRKDNMFISGGENIYPEEIEAVLLQQEDIIQALVAPVANEEYGSRPVAFVEGRDGIPDFARLRKALSEKLPKYKIPDHFFPWSGNLSKISSKPQRYNYAQKATRLLKQLSASKK